MDRIAREVAEAEFDRICEYWDVETDVTDLKEDEAESLEDLKRKIVRRIREGLLTVDEKGTPTYKLKYHDEAGFEALTELTFTVPSGAAVAAFDKFTDRQGVAKLNSYLGSMTHQPPAVFIKMDQRDWMVCQALVTLFLAS